MSAKEASISIVRGIGILIHNKYWIIITIFGVLMNIVYAVVMAAPIYYAQVIVGNQNFYSTVNTAEVNMQKYGVRITGMTNASNSFVGKIGSGLGGSAIGWILAAGGYDVYAATGEATGKVIGAVNVLNVYIPIAIFVVMALILFRYDLEEKLPEIRRENDRRMADHPAEN